MGLDKKNLTTLAFWAHQEKGLLFAEGGEQELGGKVGFCLVSDFFVRESVTYSGWVRQAQGESELRGLVSKVEELLSHFASSDSQGVITGANLKYTMSPPDRESWGQQWQWFCAQTRIQKAVLVSGRESLIWDEVWLLDWWQRAWREFQKNPKLWLYFWWDPQQQKGAIGLSPEVLFVSPQPGVYQSLAVAGTWSPRDSLSEHEQKKLKAEHELVVEDLKNKLRDQSDLRVSSPEVFRFSEQLQHWKSSVEWQKAANLTWPSRVNEARYWQSRLHPTAAVGVLSSDLDRWRELESLPEQGQRKWYGAPLTLVTENIMWSVVMIRGVFWEGKRVFSFVGGGVLPESEPELEWQELQRKWAWLERVFFKEGL